MKTSRKFLCMLLTLLMLVSLMPAAVLAADVTGAAADITAYVSISNAGSFVKDKAGKDVACVPVTVSDRNADGRLDIDETLYAAHEQYYNGGAAAGYNAYEGQYGLSLGKLWGDTSYNFGYQVNGGSVAVMGLSDTISAGDHVDAYVTQSVYPDDEAYAAFTSYTAEAAVGTSVAFTLQSAGYDENWNLVMSPLAGAMLVVDGEETQAVTDENGQASVSFSAAGTHVISAKMTKTVDEKTVTAITAPACVVTVTAPVAVTVNVAPSTVNVNFFSGSNAETALDASAVTDKGTVKVGSYNYHQYVLSVAPGEYSYRGTDGSTVLGGEPFTVTKAETINLLRANIYYNSTVLNTVGDYTITLENEVTKKNVELGTPYLTSSKLYTPTLLIAGVKHNGTVALADKWQDSYFLKSDGKFTNTPNKTTGSASTITLSVIAQYSVINVAAPADAEVSFYKQNKNFNVSPVTPDSQSTENGVTTYTFKGTAAHINYTYRASLQGKVTQAGYVKDGDNLTVTFPTDRTPDSTTSTIAYDDNSVLLNINAKNELSMAVGDSFKLRAYRAAWEIINTTTGNVMVEPDFRYVILSGDDVVSVTPAAESSVAGNCNGNADGNWMNITALKQGTAVVAVYYDALDVYGANPSNATGITTFGATDPARYGVFVVNVGDDSSVAWNPVSHDGGWDAEFDVVYYNGDAGCFTFKPTETVSAVTVQNVNGKTLGSVQTVTAAEDGSYAVPVTTGANVIAVTTESGTDYQVVRAKKISYTITNNTTGESAVNSAPVINTEDSVKITFDKLDMPIPKMSGIYNPGYLGTAKTAYLLNDSMLLTSAGTQYDFSTKNSITFTAHVAGENSLKGYISLSSMGSDFGMHRGITDEGVPANMNASEKFGDFGVLPEITFTVEDNGKTASYENATAITSLTVKGANSTGYLTGFADWTKVANGDANWTAATTAMAEYALTANVKTKDYNNTLQLRYWYDGEQPQTADLIAGATNTITGFKLDADKILNLQVVIAPTDPSLGDAKTYTYIVYPGNANLKYVHPVIKSLTAKSDDETLVMKPVLNTADTAYTLCVADAEMISLSGEQLIKIFNTAVAADKSDSVVLTKMKDGVAVGESITVLESGLANNPNRYWTCNDLDITDCDALQIVVTSYVNADITRTYNITLDRITGSENEKKAQAVDALIDAIGEVTLESEEAITAAREAYDALTDEQKALVKKESVLIDAENTLADLKKPPVTPPEEDDDDTIKVTFRLIGSTKASADVDLSNGKDGFNGAEYVTWIKTVSYTMDKGATVGDLFAQALADADLSYQGIENNYISAITAPDACGGYVLAETDNGINSGWMYTVNGKHSDVGLNDCKLKTGDKVVWHYVNDYSYEVSDWSDGSRGDASVWNLWLKAADVTPVAPAVDPTEPDDGEKDPEQEPKENNFVDVPEDTWYTEAVAWAVKQNITTGVDDTHFAPDASCNRAQMVTFLWRAAGSPEPTTTENPFTDVVESDYFYKAVLWAVENGITKGATADTFAPTQTVTRGQAVTFLWRAAKGSSTGENPFTDVADDAYYAEAVIWAVENGITNGTSAATFSPDDSCARAQIVTFLFRQFA